MLYIFSGLPGTGKSTLAAALSRRRNAVYLRIDTIEQAIRDAGSIVQGVEGYAVAYKVAAENLRIGADVVADSVNPVEITRRSWRDAAVQNKSPFIEIEIICSNLEEHRRRIESRASDISGLKLPDWTAVSEREYEQWSIEHIIIDTAGKTPDESISNLFEAVDNWGHQIVNISSKRI
jgi:predicted kinase